MTKPTYEELAAQVERLRDEITAIMSDSCGVAGYHYNGEIARWGEFSDLEEMLSETPTQSLAALKAQWQTDFLSTISQKLSSAQNSGFIEIPKSVETHTDFIKWLNETQEPTND